MKLDELRNQLREAKKSTPGSERLAQAIRRLGYPKTADIIERKADASAAVMCACGIFVDPSRSECSRCGRGIVQCMGCTRHYARSSRDSVIFCRECLKAKVMAP